jgi:hypothetical protein
MRSDKRFLVDNIVMTIEEITEHLRSEINVGDVLTVVQMNQMLEDEPNE